MVRRSVYRRGLDALQKLLMHIIGADGDGVQLADKGECRAATRAG